MWPLQPTQTGAFLLVTRYVRFCIVGASGVLVDMLVLFLLASPATLGLSLTLSKVVAAETAIFNNFLWNELWTFRAISKTQTRLTARIERLAKFNLICLSGIGLSVVLLNLQVYRLGMNIYAANLIAIVLVSLWNFLLNVRFGWRAESRIKCCAHPHTAQPRSAPYPPALDLTGR